MTMFTLSQFSEKYGTYEVADLLQAGILVVYKRSRPHWRRSFHAKHKYMSWQHVRRTLYSTIRRQAPQRLYAPGPLFNRWLYGKLPLAKVPACKRLPKR